MPSNRDLATVSRVIPIPEGEVLKDIGLSDETGNLTIGDSRSYPTEIRATNRVVAALERFN